MKLNSSRLSNQNIEANKAIGLEDIVYFNPDDLILLFKRAEEIALQRKHDLIWAKAFEIDVVLIKTLKSLGYQEFIYKNENNQENPNQLYFKKAL